MQLVHLRSQRNIENIDKESNKRKRINITYKNVYDEINQIDENDEDVSTYDIKVLKMVTLCSKKDIYIILKKNLIKAII